MKPVPKNSIKKPNFLNFAAAVLVLIFPALFFCGCSKDQTQLQSEALIRNLITVEEWINNYQLSRKSAENAEEERRIYPRLIDLQNLLLKSGKIASLNKPPISNPYTGRPEWPKESPHPVKDYRTLLSDKDSEIGRGCIEYIPFVESNVVIGYLLRAGDPATGRVFCSDGLPCIRSSP